MGFPLLDLPAEIRNLIYRQALHKDGVIKALKQPPLLCTNKQIRDEALPMYYADNKFFVSIRAIYDQMPQSIRNFINGPITGIKAHIRHIIILIHYKWPGINAEHEYILEFTDQPCGVMLSETRVGHPTADWTEYRSAKKTFYAALMDEGVLLPDCLDLERNKASLESPRDIFVNDHSLFEAAWLLAQTFPAATKSVYTMSSIDATSRITYSRGRFVRMYVVYLGWLTNSNGLVSWEEFQGALGSFLAGYQ